MVNKAGQVNWWDLKLSLSSPLLICSIFAKCMAVYCPMDSYIGLSTFRTFNELLFQFRILVITIIPSALISFPARFSYSKGFLT